MVIALIGIEAGITGFESPANEYIEQNLSIDDLLILHPNATFLGIANGDSMTGVGIYHGDILIVDRSITPNDQDVIVTTYDGEFCCKIFDKENKALISASNMYAPVSIENIDSFIIEGVVTSSIRSHRKCRLFDVRAD